MLEPYVDVPRLAGLHGQASAMHKKFDRRIRAHRNVYAHNTSVDRMQRIRVEKYLSASTKFEKTNAVLAARKPLDHLSDVVAPLKCLRCGIGSAFAELIGMVAIWRP